MAEIPDFSQAVDGKKIVTLPHVSKPGEDPMDPKNFQTLPHRRKLGEDPMDPKNFEKMPLRKTPEQRKREEMRARSSEDPDGTIDKALGEVPDSRKNILDKATAELPEKRKRETVDNAEQMIGGRKPSSLTRRQADILIGSVMMRTGAGVALSDDNRSFVVTAPDSPLNGFINKITGAVAYLAAMFSKETNEKIIESGEPPAKPAPSEPENPGEPAPQDPPVPPAEPKPAEPAKPSPAEPKQKPPLEPIRPAPGQPIERTPAQPVTPDLPGAPVPPPAPKPDPAPLPGEPKQAEPGPDEAPKPAPPRRKVKPGIIEPTPVEPIPGEPGQPGPAKPKEEPTPAPSGPNEQPTTPANPEKTPEELTAEHVKLLREYIALPKDALVALLTPELIKQHQANGTLHVLMIAIASKDDGNMLEDPDLKDKKWRYYEQMMENFIKEGQVLKGKISEADGMGNEAIRAALTGDPFGSFFVQEGGLPKVGFKIEDLSDEQARTLYEICLLEEHVRGAGISYGGSSSYSAFIPSGKWNVDRHSDCNGTANFYACVVSFSGSERLQNSMGMIAVQQHAQLCFDLGKDKNGKPVRFSKNTSHVDMSPDTVDPATGKQKEGKNPYAHNFYDFSHDEKENGLVPGIDLRKPERFIASELGEIGKISRYADASVADLQEDLALWEKVLALNPYDPTSCGNAMKTLLTLVGKKAIDATVAKEKALQIMPGFIDGHFYSVVDIGNVANLLGQETAKPLIERYEAKILANESLFVDFLRAPLSEGQRPDFENRKMVMRYVSRLMSGRAAEICKAEMAKPEWKGA